MEEIMESTATEDTTPTAEEEGTEATEQGASAEESATEQGAEAAEDTTPAAEAPEAEAQPAETFDVTYNHEAVRMPLADARKAVQHYMHLTRDGGVMDMLESMADARGQSVEELVKLFSDIDERALKDKILEDAGGNQEIADKLYELEMIKRKTAHDAAKGNRAKAAEDEANGINERLALQFNAMKDDFGLAEFSEIPKSVVNKAVESGIDLRHAYLEYQWAENKRRDANKAQQATAAKASPGSQADGVPEAKPNSFEAAMLRGLSNAL